MERGGYGRGGGVEGPVQSGWGHDCQTDLYGKSQRLERGGGGGPRECNLATGGREDKGRFNLNQSRVIDCWLRHHVEYHRNTHTIFKYQLISYDGSSSTSSRLLLLGYD